WNVRTRYDDALGFRSGRRGSGGWRRGSTNVCRQRLEVLGKCARRDNERDSNAGSESHAQESELAKSDSDHGFLLLLGWILRKVQAVPYVRSGFISRKPEGNSRCQAQKLCALSHSNSLLRIYTEFGPLWSLASHDLAEIKAIVSDAVSPPTRASPFQQIRSKPR